MKKKQSVRRWTGGQYVAVMMLTLAALIALLLSSKGSVLASGSLNWRYQTIPDANLTYIIYGDGQLLSGGDELLLVSDDGENWQPHLQTIQANAMAYGDGRFVAVGNQGKAWLSTDGITWTAQTTGALYDYLDIIYDGSQFVAVGRNTGRIVSDDGITWQVRETGTELGMLTAVTFLNNQYIAVGSFGYVKLYNDPLVGGTDYSIAGAGNLMAISTGPETPSGKVIVTVGQNGQIYRSEDGGMSWSAIESGTTEDLYDIYWNDTQFLFIAVGSRGTILTSANGSEWTDRSITSPLLSGIKSIVWDDTQYIAVTGNSTLLRSTDGISWTVEILPLAVMTNNKIEGFAWNETGSQCVAVFMSGHMATSPDGRIWSMLPDQIGQDFSDIIWGGDRFVAVGYETIKVSTDGMNWTNVDTKDLEPNLDLAAIAWGNGLFTAVAEWPAKVYTSPDGQNWTRRYETENNMALLYDIIWTGSQFVAVGDFDFILSSADGTRWLEVKAPTYPEIREYAHLAIAWGNGVFVTTSLYKGHDAYLLTSTDLLTWQRYDLNRSDITLNDITFSSDHFVAVGTRGATLISSDGYNWATPDPVTNFSLYNVHAGSGQFIAGGSSAAILSADIPVLPDPTPTALPTATPVPIATTAPTPDATQAPTEALDTSPTEVLAVSPTVETETTSEASGEEISGHTDSENEAIAKTGESATQTVSVLLMLLAAVLITTKLWLENKT